MAAASPAVELPVARDTAAAKLLRGLAKAPLQIIHAGLGVLWLVPTFGLFLTSLLPASASASKGWWQVFS
ncbi:MAG: carbohydrate ABC transporter permease, partial [Actinomycetota bacterium]